MSESTPIATQTQILSDLWIGYKADEQFKDFIEYNDLGLPLAYAIENGIVKSTKMAENFIGETFALLLEGLGIETDEGFESLSDILDI